MLENVSLDDKYSKYIQDSIDIQNFFSDLLSSNIDIETSDLSKLVETDDKFKIFNILESFNYASLWHPSQISRIEKIFDFIFSNFENKSIPSKEQLRYEIFTSKILREKIVAFLLHIDPKVIQEDLKEKNDNEYSDQRIFELIRNDDFVEFQDMVSQFDIDLDGSIIIPENFEYRDFFNFEFSDIHHKYDKYDINDDQENDFQEDLFDHKSYQYSYNIIYKGKLIEIASFFGSINIFKFLWMNKANINKNINKYLMAGGNYEILHLVEDYITYTPDDLTYAIQFHRNSIYDYIINNNEFSPNKHDIEIAIRYNNLEYLVNEMDNLKEGDYLDKNNYMLISSLSKSIENKNVLIFIFLFTQCFQYLQKGENFSINSILKKAISEKSFEIVKFLINYQKEAKDNNSLFKDLQSNDLIKGTGEIMKYLISILGDENFVIDSPLMCKASANSVVEVVEFIDQKCDMFKNDEFSDNETPFHCACLAGNFNVIKYLANSHENWIEMKDKNGILPIHNAVLSSRLKVVKYLIIKLNVDINVVDNENRTPLYYAVENEFVDIVDFLCSLNKIKINVKTLTGTTPLELAININNTKIVDILKRKGGIQNILSNI